MTNSISSPTAGPINSDLISAQTNAPNAMSPESLLLYCSSRLSSIDTTIQQYFKEQQTRNHDMQLAAKLMNVLTQGTWKDGHWGSEDFKNAGYPMVNLQDHADRANEILDIYRSAENPEVKARCEEAFKDLSGLDVKTYASNKDAKVSTDDIKKSAEAGAIPHGKTEDITKRLDSIKDVQSNASKSAELNMIQLQSLVSQRQLAIQLTTQLMQTAHEANKQVCTNIRA
jgi:hypothetical protein